MTVFQQLSFAPCPLRQFLDWFGAGAYSFEPALGFLAAKELAPGCKKKMVCGTHTVLG